MELSMDEMNFYTKYVKFNKLDPQTEQHLLAEYNKTKCKHVKHKLFNSNAKYVIHVASQYKTQLNFIDLISEGNIGLLEAIDAFNIHHKTTASLATFADPYIRKYIREYIFKNSSQVKFGKSNFNKQLIGIISANNKIYNILDGTIDMGEVNKIAFDHDVKIDDVLYVCNYLHATTTNETSNGEYTSDVYQEFTDECFEHYLMVQAENTNQVIHNIINTKLDARASDIVANRWLMADKATLQTLSTKYGVSMERIRQIEKDSLVTIKNNLTPKNIGV